MKKVLINGSVVGLLLFVISYGGLYITVRFFPQLFIQYNNPLFKSDGSRDVLFYLHAFVIALSLSWFWERFKSLFHGHFLLRGIEFGMVYALIALLPVMWITFSSLDISVTTVASWFIYGFLQAIIAGVAFAKINP